MSTIQGPPVDTDADASRIAGVWAGFQPEATVTVRVGWLAGVMERLDPTPGGLVERAQGAVGEVCG